MISADFAAALAGLRDGGVSGAVRDETVRSIVNVVGTSIGAARSTGVDIIVDTATRHGGAGAVPVPGRAERIDPTSAALATGTAAHMDDFDDTHLATIVHPAAAVFAASIPLLAERPVSGSRFVTAVALGMETELRFAMAMTPWHYDVGWHITGTVGALGAAVTCGLLLGFDDTTLARSLDIASGMPLGHREGFGTMLKPFHPGKAAVNGLLAARLAQQGCTASGSAFEDRHGYFATLSTEFAQERLTDGLGNRWEVCENTYKPFPCGIVSHPAIEAAERLHQGLAGREPVEIRVVCHPLVVDLTGNPAPHDGLSARFSTIHGVAAGLATGVVGLPEYAADYVLRADVAALRARTKLVPSAAIARDSARVEVAFADGDTESAEIAHARGSRARPMTDGELDDKVTRLIDRTLPGRAGQVLALTRGIDELADCRDFLAGVTAGADD
ncbi:MAG TPA: MmgE/PrpD family protein [Pseudonocardiaceae bacterium]|nr:MmgE/PrpD family protein [Pseudonocardiaceae bacterium]